jgi:hypothetical protein
MKCCEPAMQLPPDFDKNSHTVEGNFLYSKGTIAAVYDSSSGPPLWNRKKKPASYWPILKTFGARAVKYAASKKSGDVQSVFKMAADNLKVNEIL